MRLLRDVAVFLKVELFDASNDGNGNLVLPVRYTFFSARGVFEWSMEHYRQYEALVSWKRRDPTGCPRLSVRVPPLESESYSKCHHRGQTSAIGFSNTEHGRRRTWFLRR